MTGTINRRVGGGGAGVREDSSKGRIQPVQNFRQKNVTEFLVVCDSVFYYFYIRYAKAYFC